MNFTIKTIGCKVNIYESNKIKEELEKKGLNFIEINDNEKAIDYYIVNTCSVTSVADKKSRQKLSRAKKLHPNCKVVAIGCFVNSLDDNIKKTLNYVDLFIKNEDKMNIYDILLKNFGEVKSDKENINIKEKSVRSFIKIQDGCNQFCTYCLIPYLRGRITSRNEEDVLSEILELIKSGSKEVILTGIHLSSYGLEKCNMSYEEEGAISISRNNLISLIKKIANLKTVDGKEIERIRLGSLEPRIINEEFVKMLISEDMKGKICQNFTLSLQSGSDKILKLMNRHYSVNDFENAVNIIRKYMNASTITVDIIVGFPGENDEDYYETLEFAKKMRFYNPNIFPYSKREGTKAYNFKNQLTTRVKHDRAVRLIKECEIISREIEDELMDIDRDVLVEEIIEENGVKYGIGYTKGYIKKKIRLE